MAETLAIVIPFFQRKSGILIKAVTSALSQVDAPPFTIIVVDDASPIRAHEELETIMQSNPGRIRIIEQANAGPAAARNKALDNLPAETSYVAFLDSDDEWIPTHLSNAVQVMDAGYDFYFTDHFQLNQTVSAFNRAKRIDVAQHKTIGGSPFLRAYAGDMFDQILMGNIIGTSTVVYRFSKFQSLRFREEFVYAGEDYLFWLDLASKTSNIAFSSLCECTYGEGVNIFAGSGWGTDKSLIRIHYELKFKKALPRIFHLSEAQTVANTQAIRGLRRSFVADLLHRIAHKKEVDGKVLRSQFKIDPQTFWFFIPLAVRVVLKK